MPELISETLLVVAPFKDRGVEYLRGDRVPVRHRRIRQIARDHPELFAMEFASEPVDPEWLANLDLEYEERYLQVKRGREEQKARQKRAIRQELESQDLPQPVLERRFREQQEEEEKRKQQVREEREREVVERDVALTGEGFHF
jgi:hypothetical protein